MNITQIATTIRAAGYTVKQHRDVTKQQTVIIGRRGLTTVQVTVTQGNDMVDVDSYTASDGEFYEIVDKRWNQVDSIADLKQEINR